MKKIIKNTCLVGLTVVVAIVATVFVTRLWFGDSSLVDAACMVILSSLVFGTGLGNALNRRDGIIDTRTGKMYYSTIVIIVFLVGLALVNSICLLCLCCYSERTIEDLIRNSSSGYGIVFGTSLGGWCTARILRSRDNTKDQKDTVDETT